MEKLTLALIYGGISSEREVSLNSGKQVYEALDKDKYNIIRYDPKTDLSRLVEDAHKIDAALIILHGIYGEDGTIQGLLDLLDIPYQGSGVLGSAIAINKLVSKKLYEKAGVPVPDYIVRDQTDPFDAEDVVGRLGLPVVVKPVNGGSSIAISIVRSQDQLQEAVDAAHEHDNSVIMEAFIEGVELTCGVIGNETLEAFPLIEIVPNTDYEFFDYEAKYKPGASQEICPARIDAALTEKVQNLGIMAHQALHCEGYSRTDMILKDGEAYVLETNTIPGMTATSLLPQSAQAAGVSFTALLDRLIELSMAAKANEVRAKST